jgi:hypothetical protein
LCPYVFFHSPYVLISFLHLWFFSSVSLYFLTFSLCVSFSSCIFLSVCVLCFFHSFHLPFLTRTNTRHDIICRDQRGERIQYYLISKPIWQIACNCLPTVLLTTEDVNALTNTTYIPTNCALNCPREIISVLYVNDDFMRLLIQRLAIPIAWSGTKTTV